MKLRAYILRNFLVAGFMLMLFTTLGIAWLSRSSRITAYARYYQGLTQTLAEILKPSLSISDYGEIQRLLKVAEGNQNVTIGLVTIQKDIVMADYSKMPLFKNLRLLKGELSCQNALTHLGALPSSQVAYCAEIRSPEKYGKSEAPGLVMAISSLPGLPFPISGFVFVMAFFAGAVILTGLWLSRQLRRYFVFPIEEIIKFVGSASLEQENQTNSLPASPAIVELRDLSSSFTQLIERSRREYSKRKEQEAAAKIQQARQYIYSQVAHDIRSPLAALDSVLKDISQLPEDKRIIVRSAVGRIHDIANDLINKNRQAPAADTASSVNETEPTSVSLLSALIDPLITEKRLQYRSRTDITIDFQMYESAYGLFAAVQSAEFKRALSNLVNNAVEALDEKGSVVIALDSKGGNILIKVQDNGKGIPPEILAKLGQKGETYDKEGGSGLGLYHAKTAVQSWQGSLDIESEVGQGTTLTITLPKAPSPDWFVSRLILAAGKPVLILDDDASIHRVWQGRFDSLRAKTQNVQTLHFSAPEKLRAWVKANPEEAMFALYLSDYELLGHKETGLDLAQELGTGERTILVTSRCEEAGILERCQRLKVRMIPKNLAAYVPISVENVSSADPSRCDAVLIDDDPLVRKTWEIAARQAGKTLAPFINIQSFLNQSRRFTLETIIYIDNELGNGVKGKDESLKLHELGFKNILLTTGSDPSSFPPMPWIKGIVGKEARFREDLTPIQPSEFKSSDV